MLPNGMRASITDNDGASVFVPEDGHQNGKQTFTDYSYFVSDFDGTIYVDVMKGATFNELSNRGKTSEQYQPFTADHSSAKMSYIDYIYRKLPLQEPKRTVDICFLSVIGNMNPKIYWTIHIH